MRRSRLAKAVAAAAVLIALSPPAVAAATPDTTTPDTTTPDTTTPDTTTPDTTADVARELLVTYAPHLVVRTQTAPCGEGEPYLPVSVEAVLGRPDVVLRAGNGEETAAPTTSDLAGADPSAHLDLPGAALRPGCTYETWHRGLEAEPTTYARLAVDPGHPDRLVAQYWLFYVYNDWNDRHEGDWEMVQIVFDATDPAEALAEGPSEVAYAQHEGAEVSPWADGRVRTVDDTHPLVYVGAGSHASYFSAHRWFGASAASGFGCDDTRPPSSAVPLRVDVIGPEDAGWLAYPGRWGEKQPSFNNGPTGPRGKVTWDTPVQWMIDEGRNGAVAVPASGSAVTDFFCSASGAGSRAFMRLLDRPWAVSLAALALVLSAVALVRATRWRPVTVRPVLQERAAGQTILAAAVFVGRRWRTFVGIGSVQLVPAVLVGVIEAVASSDGDVADVIEVVGDTSAWATVLLGAIALLVALPVSALVATASTLVVRSADREVALTAGRAIRAAGRRWRAASCQIGSIVVLVVCGGSIVLLPLGLWLAGRWAVLVPASLDAARPWRESARLTAGRRWTSLALALANALTTTVVPPLVGTVVLLTLGWGFTTVNLVAAAVALVVHPFAAVVIALHHGSLARHGGATPDLSAAG